MRQLLLALVLSTPTASYAGAISKQAYEARVAEFGAAEVQTSPAAFLGALPLVGDCAAEIAITGGDEEAIYRYSLVGSAVEGSGRTHSRGFIWYWTPNADGYDGRPISYIRQVTLDRPVFSPLALISGNEIGYEDSSLDVSQVRVVIRRSHPGVWLVWYETTELGPEEPSHRLQRVDTNVCAYTSQPAAD